MSKRDAQASIAGRFRDFGNNLYAERLRHCGALFSGAAFACFALDFGSMRVRNLICSFGRPRPRFREKSAHKLPEIGRLAIFSKKLGNLVIRVFRVSPLLLAWAQLPVLFVR